MKNLVFLLISLSAFAETSQQQPGCWSVARGLNDERARQLSKSCQDFREHYLQTLKKLSRGTADAEANLKKELEKATSFQTPYDAILFSVLIQRKDAPVLEGLKSRASVEKKLAVKFPYAIAALERIEQGKCSSRFASEVYTEICNGYDPMLERMAAVGAGK